MIRLLIFLLAAGFWDTCNPSNASLPIWLLIFLSVGNLKPTLKPFFKLYVITQDEIFLLNLAPDLVGEPVVIAVRFLVIGDGELVVRGHV